MKVNKPVCVDALCTKEIDCVSEMHSGFAQSINKAGKSPLYRKLWKNVHASSVTDISDLGKLPFLDRKVLFEATLTKQSKIAVAPVSQWFLGYEESGAHEWYPYSAKDFLQLSFSLNKMASVIGLKGHVIVLAVVDTPPKITSFIPYLWLTASQTADLQMEFIIGSLDWYDTMGMSWIEFIQKRKPTVLFTSAKNCQLFADKVEKTLGKSVMDVLPDMRAGIFYSSGLVDQPACLVESFQVYSPTENMLLGSECKNHRGMHLWLDRCVAELLPAQSKEALLLENGKVGTVGELIITNFAECLPLIRYKTGSIVRIEGFGRCSCGCGDPRITLAQ